MSELTSGLAASYAQAVSDLLAPEFPALDESTLGGLGQIVKEDIAWQCKRPSRSFEVIVTYTREWRLVPDRAGGDWWRVQIVCRRDDPTADDRVRERLINEALRAITVDATDRRNHGRA